MQPLDSRFTPNQAEVAAEVIDGEAILINLTSGAYYSLDNAGSLAWELITAGHTLAEVAAAVAARYDVQAAQAEADVARLADELARENLVLPAQQDAGQAPEAAPGTAAGAAKQPYASITLNIYRDMGDMLALDPPMPAMYDIPWDGSPPATES